LDNTTSVKEQLAILRPIRGAMLTTPVLGEFLLISKYIVFVEKYDILFHRKATNA